MAAKRGKQGITRREALTGGSFDADSTYKDIANAGLREPLLFGGIAVVAGFGISRRGQVVDSLTALDAAQPHKTTGNGVPTTKVAAAKAKFKVEVTVSWPASAPVEFAWLKDASTGEVLTYSIGGGGATSSAEAAELVSLVDEGRRIVPIVYYSSGGGLYEGVATTAELPQ
eukprot:CAMPEP_0119076500 /NCGR_PEP_ID=MMETSP1178-20130426/87465_1 /TAXON_ID=33656 /ORGANISM="unid sp, Strain CCMP2000" /LENGTH=170 /DNA_ID=CAMNT_0007058789 /DNA_START=139 /DNA_END=651 /DNA_ORIENTATION=-